MSICSRFPAYEIDQSGGLDLGAEGSSPDLPDVRISCFPPIVALNQRLFVSCSAIRIDLAELSPSDFRLQSAFLLRCRSLLFLDLPRRSQSRSRIHP